jgi:hypothetical protein
VYIAEGCNALLAGGSVVWMDLTGTVYSYHRDYYQNFYVDSFVWLGS